MATAGVQLWSTTAASNSTADPAVNWAEGQAPSSVNDSARAMMASVAKWRDDISGSTSGLSTGGSSTAYTVTTNSTFATAAAMSGAILTIIPHTTSGAAPTLAVDSLTARAINVSTGVAVETGALISGTPYLVKYIHASTEFILVGGTAAIKNARLATMAANTIKANATGSTATPTDATLGAGLAFSGSALVISQTLAPQGRLTPTSATPIIATDASAQSTVYYTPYAGNLIPIYDGSNFVLTAFSELSMVMSGANFAANGIYDLYIASDSGTLRLGIGPVWGTLTAGSGARGTGAGTTELQRVSGLWTNKNSMTVRYASGSTFTAAANQATYVGSIVMDGTNSQVSCHVSYGQSRKCGIWNAYNRKKILLSAGDSTASWTYDTQTLRQSRATAGNTLQIFTGLPEEFVIAEFNQKVGVSTTSENPQIGIGLNSTTAISGFSSTDQLAVNFTIGLNANLTLAPTIGINNLNMLEAGGSVATNTFNGTEAKMALRAFYEG